MNQWRSFFTKSAPYFIILLFTLFLFRSFFSENYFLGHDSLYHISSTEAIVTTLKSGNFNLDILPTVAYDFGYGSGMLYSQLFHLCAALLSFLTGDLILALKFTHIIVYFLTGCAFYILLKNLTRHLHSVPTGNLTHHLYAAPAENPRPNLEISPAKTSYPDVFKNLLPLLGSLLYLSAPYHLADHLVRDAETEATVFLFIPLILNSLFHLLENRHRRFFPLFVVGYSGLFLSNSALALFFTIFLAFALLLNHKITFKKSFFLLFLKATILVTLIIAPYYLNIIQQRSASDYVVFSDQTTSNNYYYLSTSTTSFDKLLIPETSDDYLYISLTLNFLLILGATLCIIKYLPRFRNHLKTIDVSAQTIITSDQTTSTIRTFFFTLALTLALFSLLLILPIFPWDSLPALLTPLQFAWRLETILLPALIILTVFYLSTLKSRPLQFFALATCLISCFYYPTLVQHNYPLEYSASAYPSAYYGLGWGHEYLPERANLTLSGEISNSSTPSEDLALASHPSVPIITSGFATISNVESHTPNLTFSVSDLTSESVTIELPRLYYLGYKITTKTGKILPYEESPSGFIQIKLSSPETIIVEYANTNLIKISRFLALVAILYLGYLSILKNKFHKNQD